MVWCVRDNVGMSEGVVRVLIIGTFAQLSVSRVMLIPLLVPNYYCRQCDDDSRGIILGACLW